MKKKFPYVLYAGTVEKEIEYIPVRYIIAMILTVLEFVMILPISRFILYFLFEKTFVVCAGLKGVRVINKVLHKKL